MSAPHAAHTCPDCDEPLAYTFMDTAGVGAWKRGEGFNATPDTTHYVCFACAKAWKQRMSGPLTPDLIGELAFFSCRRPGCGQTLMMTHASAVPTEIEMACPARHRYAVCLTDDGGLTLGDRE